MLSHIETAEFMNQHWLVFCLNFFVKIWFVTLGFTCFTALQAGAVTCDGFFLEVYKKPAISERVAAILEPVQTRDEITRVFKKRLRELGTVNLNVAVSAQTLISSKKSLEAFLDYYQTFPDTGFSVASKEHALLVQTSYLLEMPAVDLLNLLNEVPADIVRPHSKTAKAAKFQSPLARIMILQTALFSGSTLEEVIDFYKSSAGSSYSGKSFAHLSIVQMAFFSNQKVADINHLYRAFPYVPGMQDQVSGDILRRLTLFAE